MTGKQSLPSTNGGIAGAVASGITRVASRLVLIAVYYVIVTPVALVRRLLIGNPIRHDVGDMGYWQARVPATNDATDMRTPT